MGNLLSRIASPRTLRRAFASIREHRTVAGIDGITSEAFARIVDSRLRDLSRELHSGAYVPAPVLRVWVPKPASHEKRALGIPTIRDRVVMGAIRIMLEPLFDPLFSDCSYGYRQALGARDALRAVDELIQNGNTCVLEADFDNFFDSIPHEPLLRAIERGIAGDSGTLRLIAVLLQQPVSQGGRITLPDGRGIIQGSPLSPLLANIFLDSLDREIERAGFNLVRYADDFVIMCADAAQAEWAWEILRNWTASAQLTLHPDKTGLRLEHEPGEGFDFLSYHFEQQTRRPSARALAKFKAMVYARLQRIHRPAEAIAQLNIVLRNWFNYFRETSAPDQFRELDAWITDRVAEALQDVGGFQGSQRPELPLTQALKTALAQSGIPGRGPLHVISLARLWEQAAGISKYDEIDDQNYQGPGWDGYI